MILTKFNIFDALLLTISALGIFSTILLGGMLSDVSTVVLPIFLTARLLFSSWFLSRSQILIVVVFLVMLVISSLHGVQFEFLHRLIIWLGGLLIFISAYNAQVSNHCEIDKWIDLIRWLCFFALLLSNILIDRDASTPLVLTLFFGYTLGKRTLTYFDVIFLLISGAAIFTNGARIALLTIAILLLHSTFVRFNSSLLKLFLLSCCIVIGLSFFNQSTSGANDNGINAFGLSFNTSGRVFIWTLMIQNIMENWLLGIGVDMPESIKTTTFMQPHNDYLRVATRAGLIVLSAFLMGLFLVSRKLKVVAFSSRHWGGYYMFLALLTFMLTDNVLSYFYVLYPVFLIVGLFLKPVQNQNLPKSLNFLQKVQK